jgi:hypothetical protein
MRAGGSDMDIAEDLGHVWCDAVWLAELFPTFRQYRGAFFFEWNVTELLADRHSATPQMFVLCSLTISRDGPKFMW